MRTKILSAITLLSLGLGACKHAIDIPYSEAHEALTVLFVADNTATAHQMRISRTNIGAFVPVSDASAELLVDGVSVPISTVNAQQKPGLYKISHSFKPGQRLQLNVRHSGTQTHAEAVMPAMPNLTSVTTAPHIVAKSWGPEEQEQWIIKLQDKANVQDYYRIAIAEQAVYVDPETKKEFTPFGTTWLHLNTDADYILSDGKPKNKAEKGLDLDMDLLLGDSQENPYHIFSDRLFDGKEATIYPISGRLPRRGVVKQYIIWDEVSPGREESKTLEYAFHRYIVYLQALSEDTYRYYRSLGVSLDSDEESPFNTPVQVYTNVQGGAGILGVCTTNTYIIEKKYSDSGRLY